MSRSNSVNGTIDVEMFQIGKIASISFDENTNPVIQVEREEYQSELERLVKRINSKTLRIHVSYKMTDNISESSALKFTDGYKSAKRGSNNFLYAFSHELTHNPIKGQLIRGVVKKT